MSGFTASWEFDFWGRFRRAVEAADAELDASVEDYDDVLVILLSDVATNYVQYRTFQQRLLYARANVEIQRKVVQLATDKFEGGATTERDTHQAKQVLAETEALIPALEIGKRQAANRLCVLLGMPPTNLDAILGEGRHTSSADRMSSSECRPTCCAAGPMFAARNDRSRLKVPALALPSAICTPIISLPGTIGVEAEDFGDLFDTPESMFGSISPGCSLGHSELWPAGEQRPSAGRQIPAAGLCLSGSGAQCGPGG